MVGQTRYFNGERYTLHKTIIWHTRQDWLKAQRIGDDLRSQGNKVRIVVQNYRGSDPVIYIYRRAGRRRRATKVLRSS